MKTEHTPEPWVYSEDCDSRGHYVGFGPVNKFVGETHISVNNFCTVQAKTNARRIVACVNACQGLDTRFLENLEALSLLEILVDTGFPELKKEDPK